jgi:hypothetical protein
VKVAVQSRADSGLSEEREQEQARPMTQILLRRTGNLPLSIDTDRARLIFEADSKTSTGNGKTRWHVLRIYKENPSDTPEGPNDNPDFYDYIVAIEYHSEFEPEHCDAMETVSTKDLLRELQGYNPTAKALGLPARTDKELAQNGGRNRVIHEDLKGRWEHLVSHAAEKLGLVEHRPVGRPSLSKEGESTGVVSARFTESTLAKIDTLRGELSRGEFVRKATEAYIQIKTS